MLDDGAEARHFSTQKGSRPLFDLTKDAPGLKGKDETQWLISSIPKAT
jgi:hypothetical protein